MQRGWCEGTLMTQAGRAGRAGCAYRRRGEGEVFVVGMRREGPAAEDRVAREAQHVAAARDHNVDELREVRVDVPLQAVDVEARAQVGEARDVDEEQRHAQLPRARLQRQRRVSLTQLPVRYRW